MARGTTQCIGGLMAGWNGGEAQAQVRIPEPAGATQVGGARARGVDEDGGSGHDARAPAGIREAGTPPAQGEPGQKEGAQGVERGSAHDPCGAAGARRVRVAGGAETVWLHTPGQTSARRHSALHSHAQKQRMLSNGNI
eukprot:362542-Chlamydomonas_euryale.AAC.6